MNKRLNQRRMTNTKASFIRIALRSRALIAFTATVGVAFQSTIVPVAIGEEQTSVESYLSDLVGKVTDAENQVASLENELGGLRESANKARVDLATAQDDAQAAQSRVLSARERLEASDKEVAKAQGKLDDIARSAYAQGGDAHAVNLAAGGSNAVADALDRSSYIKLATEKQRTEVGRLDLARTQTANEESQLRTLRSGADAALSTAVGAFKTAEEAMRTAQEKLHTLQSRYNDLVKERDMAEARLRAARSAVDTLANTKPDATNSEKRAAAEEAVSQAEVKIGAIDNAKQNETTTAELPAPQQTPPPANHNGAQTAAEQSTTGHSDTGQSDAGQAATEQPTAEQTDARQTVPEQNDAEQATEEALPSPIMQAPPAQPGITGWAADDSNATGSRDSSNLAPTTDTADQVAGSVNDVSNTATTFEQSTSGDSQRQQAIDGLIKSGEAALLAGFTAYTSGNQDGALDAALQAGSRVAGEQYDAAMGAQSDSSSSSSNSSTGSGSTGSNNGSADNSVNTSGSAAEKIETVIARAQSQMGVTYAWGGGDTNGPTLGIRDGGVADSYGDYNKIGFDCSGLMMYAFAGAGISLQHYSGYQYTSGTQVPVSEAKRGDMLFWGAGGSQHVALYLGDGQMIEAKQSGTSVMISPVRWSGIQPMAVRLIQ